MSQCSQYRNPQCQIDSIDMYTVDWKIEIQNLYSDGQHWGPCKSVYTVDQNKNTVICKIISLVLNVSTVWLARYSNVQKLCHSYSSCTRIMQVPILVPQLAVLGWSEFYCIFENLCTTLSLCRSTFNLLWELLFHVTIFFSLFLNQHFRNISAAFTVNKVYSYDLCTCICST